MTALVTVAVVPLYVTVLALGLAVVGVQYAVLAVVGR